MQKKPKLLLVEDHELMCQGLTTMLAPEFAIVGRLPDGEGAATWVERLAPDVVLLDLSLPRRSGMLVLEDLATAYPRLAIVIVTQHVDPVLAGLAFQLGALGYVPKDSGVDELRKAIHEALAGRRYLSPRVAALDSRVLPRTPKGYRALTPREQDIVRMIGRSKTSEEIGRTLGISHWTVHFHRKNILRKLGLHSEHEMIRYAVLVEHAWAEEGQSLS